MLLTPIQSSAGDGAANLPADVFRVQCLLNMMPPGLGGPAAKLKLDGIAGPDTIAAIHKFQVHHFGPYKADSRIDPDGPTEKLLRSLEGAPVTEPMMFVRPARELAMRWINDGVIALRASKPGVLNAFKNCFPNAALAGPVSLLAALQRMQALLNSQHAIRYLHADDDLCEIAIASPAGISVTFKFCEPDPVNGWGCGPKTRAGILLQCAFNGAERLRSPLAIDVPYRMCRQQSSANALAQSGNVSWFCQWVSTGQRTAFHCISKERSELSH